MAATEQVVRASRTDGYKKGGVVWHTQGSGKSIAMAFLAGTLLTDPRLKNPHPGDGHGPSRPGRASCLAFS